MNLALKPKDLLHAWAMPFIFWMGMGLVFAQQPTFFMFGQEKLRGMQVYSIAQNKDRNYLISTNDGLYLYDYHEFSPVPCLSNRGQAMFHLRYDGHEYVYFHNLNNQIFRFDGKNCEVFYELGPKEMSPDLDFRLGRRGEVFILGRQTIVLNTKGVTIAKGNFELNPWGEPLAVGDHGLVFHQAWTDTLRVWQDGTFTSMNLKHSNAYVVRQNILDFVKPGKQAFGFSIGTRKVYRFEPETGKLELASAVDSLPYVKGPRVYRAGGRIWVAGPLPGVWSIEGLPPRLHVERFFGDYLISDVYEDMDGNLLFGTFDHGILVVPDIKATQNIIPLKDEFCESIATGPSGKGILIGTSKGRLLLVNDDLSTSEIIPPGLQAIEGVHQSQGNSLQIVDNGMFHLRNVDGKIRTRFLGHSLKGVSFRGDSIAILATNRGLWRYDLKNASQQAFESIPEVDFRIHSLQSESSTPNMYAYSTNGLIYILQDFNWAPVNWNGSKVYPTAIATWQDTLFAVIPGNRILKVFHGEVFEVIEPQSGFKVNASKITVDDLGIWARSSHNLHLIDFKGNILRDFNREYNLESTRIFDFLRQGDVVWISQVAGVQALDLNRKTEQGPPPRMRIALVRCNDSVVSPNGPGDFGSNERKVEIQLAIPSLRAGKESKIFYRLGNQDEPWTLHHPENPPILFNALAPGRYVFEAKAERNALESEPVQYEFTIATPWHSTWWFWVICISTLGLFVGLAFRRQMYIHERKIKLQNELNSSKLTAIQSQMNPHFIFNSLNSIQDLILKGDTENSYDYINTFSNLVRSALKFSEMDFISFEDELNMLRLYLSLEQLRFKQGFTYTIDSTIEESILIPPFLIQPFVENALIHGLLHKSGPKQLLISFQIGENLTCIIEDNGVGRKEAELIRNRRTKNHESFAGKAMRKRLDILAEVHQGQFGFEIEDLEEDGKATGTRVHLTLPFKRKF